MTRIFVTGNAGSGKTTLAREIGKELNLPVFSLDGIVWQPGWRKTAEDCKVRLIAELMARPAWVIDGVSSKVLEAADIVIFLDVRRRTAFSRCARRNWRYLFRSRPDLPENCPEILIIPKLLGIIWRFPARVRPGLLQALAARKEGAYIVRTPEELNTALQALSVRN